MQEISVTIPSPHFTGATKRPYCDNVEEIKRSLYGNSLITECKPKLCKNVYRKRTEIEVSVAERSKAPDSSLKN